MKIRYAIRLNYQSLEGQDHEVQWLGRETAEERAASREKIDADVAASLTDEQIAQLETLLADDSADVDEGLVLSVDEKTFPLYIVASANVVAQREGALDGDFTIGTEDQNESPMCDGGAGRRETLRHAREAFRTIGTLPELLEGLVERIAALESAVVPTAPTVPATEPAVPAAEAAPATDPVVTEPAQVPVEENTPPGEVALTSPLSEEGTPPAQDPPPAEEPPAVEGSPLVLDPYERSLMASILKGMRSAEIKL